VGAALGPRAASAQERSLLDGVDGFPFRAPYASSLEPRTRLAPVRIHRGDRRRTVALVDLGDAFAVWIRKGSPRDGAAPAGGGRGRAAGEVRRRRGGGARGFRLAAALSGGAFTRFDLQSSNNEFIEAHFRVGLQLRARWSGWAARAELYHVSSHLGDEYMVRTGERPVSTAREGIEVLVETSPLPGLLVYGGPGTIVRTKRNFVAASVRGGAAWEPRTIRWGPFRPYAAGEAFSWAELGWDPMLAAQAGVRFGHEHFRVALTAGAGPSRAEQFFRSRETLWGVMFTLLH